MDSPAIDSLASAHEPPKPGQFVDRTLGPYKTTKLLGAGGMGEVYLAEDSRLEPKVALKVLAPRLLSSPQSRARFLVEARSVSRLNHPNVCTLYDIGQQDGVDFLVMEYLEGETLAERLERAPLSLDQVLRYAIEITGALDKAHRHGVTHRDLKPVDWNREKQGLFSRFNERLIQDLTPAVRTLRRRLQNVICSSGIRTCDLGREHNRREFRHPNAVANHPRTTPEAVR
jgi:serine/threonine protein kinase